MLNVLLHSIKRSIRLKHCERFYKVLRELWMKGCMIQFSHAFIRLTLMNRFVFHVSRVNTNYCGVLCKKSSSKCNNSANWDYRKMTCCYKLLILNSNIILYSEEIWHSQEYPQKLLEKQFLNFFGNIDNAAMNFYSYHVLADMLRKRNGTLTAHVSNWQMFWLLFRFQATSKMNVLLRIFLNIDSVFGKILQEKYSKS